MKKLFAVIVIAASMTACNDTTKTGGTKAADSASMAPMAPDTAAMKMDTTAMPMTDTTKPKM